LAHAPLEEPSSILHRPAPLVRDWKGARTGAVQARPMIDTNIVLYQTEWCPYCARVRSKMTDLLLDYKIVNVPRDHELRTVVKEQFGVTGVPSMIDGDVKIADDDAAIVAYLERKYKK
jgi:glutaredoxin 3